MRIGIATYRTLSVVALGLLVLAVWFLTDGRWMEAAIVLAALVALVVTQALLLRCHHCGARPGLWILACWTILLDYELYIADALFLRQCPRCQKPISRAQASGV
jgi:hypothetical protein